MAAEEKAVNWTLVAGLILLAIGIAMSFAADHTQLPTRLEVVVAISGILLAPVGAILYAIGSFQIFRRLLPASRVILGIATLAVSLGAATAFPPNVHTWTISLMLPVLTAFCVGCIFLANGAWICLLSRTSK